MESTPINIIIDNIIRENKIYRFSSELQYTEDDGRKKMLRDILRSFQNDNNDKSTKARENLNLIRDEINLNQYKKKWFRLSKEQKNDKIIEYYENETDEENEEKEVLEMLENDTLKNKCITYDNKKGEISDIAISIKATKKNTETKIKKKSKKGDSGSEQDSSSQSSSESE